MLETIFCGLFDTSYTSVISPVNFLLCISCALVSGLILAGCYMYRSRYTQSFVATLAMLDIQSGDDGIHGTSVVQIDGGTFTISAQEGMEGTYIQINGGTFAISASDDGINAAHKSNSYSVAIEITGGEITIVMGSGDTDAIDSNGDLSISGGTIHITGNSAFDYDGTGTYTDGTLIVNGTQITTLTQSMMGRGGMAPGGNMKGGKVH